MSGGRFLLAGGPARTRRLMPIDISVVIPTFRRPLLLTEALASVLRQTGATLEVFVIDDCPDGSAREVVAGLCDPRVTYTANPQPTGGFPSIVRNLGWPRATGTYVHFLDDDDIVPDGHYAAVKDAFESHPGVGLVFGRIEPFGGCPPEQLQHERDYFAAATRNAARCSRFGKFAFVGWTLFGSALLVCSAGVVRRKCVADLDGFDPCMRLMEDADFYCRVMRTCGAHFMDRITLHYRIGSPSLMHAPDPTPEQRQAEQEGIRRIWSNYRNDHGLLEFLALAALTRLFLKYI
jgi:glycosyltransferase involved in cell wall biosynthesis